ncbi:MAG: zinc ribbon domain-containing protein [Anaerolinea sp.]|nr:zinc ribbon domain-containing protein [Anaerolinea sp.]
MNSVEFSGLITGGLAYLALTLVAALLAMIVWTYRDMRARSRDAIMPLIAALMVGVLTVPGLLIYLFLRPRETLAEAYERSLEEEALLQEIEEKPVCPGCRQRIRSEWQACPECHTRLKRPCVRCGQLLELTWDICPFCTSAQPNYSIERASQPSATSPTGHVRPAGQAVDHVDERATGSRRARTRRFSEPLEFIDGEE